MRYFVIKEIGSQDSTPYAVAEHVPMLNGDKYIKIMPPGWFEKEDAARACAHSYNFPEY